ncbi:Choline transport protein [Beauveria bassiana]|nr:Choline transport protein [Beauveria bassiana]
MAQIILQNDVKAFVSHDTTVEDKSSTGGELGIKPKVHFSLLGAIGVQYSVTSAPIAIGAYMSLAIGLGGSPAYFWGFFMVGLFQLLVCLATAELASAIPHCSAHFVFAEFTNESGWASDGLVFFLALLPAVGCLSAFDNATHLTDELENPQKQVPQVIIGSFLMSYLTTIPMIVVYQFCNIEPESLLAAPGNQPFIQLMQNAFRSFAMTALGTSMIIFCFFIAGTAALISWSRLYWSFSAQGALPFSITMSKLSSRDALPINALCWNTVLICAIGAISIGSTTAMNALLGAANLCLLSAFAIVFGLMLYRGRKVLDPERWFNLGRWGDLIVWASLIWVIFISVMFCFPLYLPVTAEVMNWTSLVFAGVLILAGAYWLCVYSRRGIVGE